MVKIKEDMYGKELQCEIYLDTKEHIVLRDLHKLQTKDWDAVGIVTGGEGDGKSRYVAQRAYVMNSNFTIDNIVFTPEQFNEAIDKLPKGSTIIWDEADGVAEHHASIVTQTLTKKFKRIRKNNLCIFIVTPTFFDMNKYFAIHRARYLVHIYSVDFKRGFFKFYGKKSKQDLYLNGKKTWNMNCARSTFIGRFTNLPKNFPVDYSDGGEYDIKKEEATKELSDVKISDKKSLTNVRSEVVNKFLIGLEKNHNLKIKQTEVAEWLGVNKSAICRGLKKEKEC